MPEVVVTRELSVGEVNQIQHRRNIVIISILTLVFLGAFFFSLRDLSPAYAIGIVILLGFFLISFINIRVGFVLVILAFLFSPEINLPFTKFRDFTIRAEDLLIITIILSWLGRLAMGLQKHFIIPSPLNFPIFLIIVWNIVCSWRGIMLYRGEEYGMDAGLCILTNLKLLEFFMIYFLVMANLNDIREVKFIFYVLIITTLIVCIYVLFQIPKTQIFTTYRLTAPFEGKPEPNTLGAYFVIFLGMALGIFIYAEKSLLRRICAILAFLLPLPIMFSFSRSAYFASLLIIFIIALISKKKWLIYILIFFMILSPLILPKSVIDRALYNFRDPRYFGFLDQSFGERFFSFKKAWITVKFSPIFGLGVSAAGVVLDNQYARVVMETGLIGLLLFFWLMTRLIKLGWHLFKRIEKGWIKGMALGYITIVIAMLLHGLGNITFYIVRIAEPFWALAALVAFSAYYLNQQKKILDPSLQGLKTL